MQAVRCNKCGWIGSEEELLRSSEADKCPRCEETEYLMDLSGHCYFDSEELEKLWEMLGDIPVNDNDEIEEEFLEFPVGTYKEEIWKWFDERYPDGVCRLMQKGE